MTDRPLPSALRRALLPLLAALAFVPAVLSGWRPEEPRRFGALPPPSSGPEEPARYVERFIEARPSPRSLHTPTVTELPGGDLIAVWKAARSGDAPVVLSAARFDRRAGAWGTPWPVTTSHRTERELGRVVSTFTNPVLFTRGDGEVSLVYVTAWWEWSSSSVALKTSRDEGRTWTPARRLVTSPVANAGTLVRAAPVRYRDGSVGVPAYHELVGVFPQMLRLSASGEVLDRTRMHRGQVALQPSVAPLDDRHAVALMRNYLKGQVYVTRTEDAGASWGAVTEAGLPNPNAPVMAVRLRDGAILLVFNNSRNSRERLSLALSRDGGGRWSVFHGLEEGVLDHEGNLANFGYPYAIQSADGTVHVFYVWHQLTHVKHVSFNEAWIRERAR
ncbi:MAG: sialidase family protein [Candidatus Rokuibacteriota bacterium]